MAEGGRAAFLSKLELNLVEDGAKKDHGGTSSDTIVVQGFPVDTNEELLEMYFENFRRSGGGDIKQVQIIDGVAYITFVEIEVAQRVVSHSPHQVTGQPLTVTLFCPPPQKPCYENKVLILGLNSAVTKELLTNFLETERGIKITEFLYGEEEGKVVVTFSEKFDFNALRKACKEREIEETFLQVEKVTVSNCILVHNLQPSTSHDAVLFYFENKKRSGGGECERVEMKAEERYCLVYFEDHSVIDRVLIQKHKIDGADVEVHIHHECLGKRSSRSRLDPDLSISKPEMNDSATLEAEKKEEDENKARTHPVIKEDSSNVSSNPDKESDFVEMLDWQENDGRNCELLMLIKFRMAHRNIMMRDIKKIPCCWNFLAYWNFYTKNKQGKQMLDEIVKKNGCTVAVCSDDEYLFLIEVHDTYFEQEVEVVHFIYVVMDNVYKCAQHLLYFDILLVDQRIQRDVLELVKQTKELDIARIELMGEQEPDAVYVICTEKEKMSVLQVVTKIISDVKECFKNHEEVVSVDFKWQRVMTKFGYLQTLGNKYPHVTIIPDEQNDALVLKGPRDETRTAADDFWELLGTANSEVQEDSFSPGCQFEIFTSPEMCDYINNSIIILPILWIPNHLTKKIHLFFKTSEQLKGVDKFIKGCVQEKLYPLSKDHLRLPLEKIRSLEELKKKHTGKIIIDQSPTGLLVTTADDIYESVNAAVLEIIIKETYTDQTLHVPNKPEERDGQPGSKAEHVVTRVNQEDKDLLSQKAAVLDKDIAKSIEERPVHVADQSDKIDEQPISQAEPVLTRVSQETTSFLSEESSVHDMDIAKTIEVKYVSVLEKPDNRDGKPVTAAEPILISGNQEIKSLLFEKSMVHDMDITKTTEVKSMHVNEKTDKRDEQQVSNTEVIVTSGNQETKSFLFKKSIVHDKDIKKTTEVKSVQVVNDPDKRDEQPVSKAEPVVTSGNQETKGLLSQKVHIHDEEIKQLIEFKSVHIEDQPDKRDGHPVIIAEPIATSGNQETTVSVKCAKHATVEARECTYCKKIGTFQYSRCNLPYCCTDCQKTDWPQHKTYCKEIKVLKAADGLEESFEDDHFGAGDVSQGSRGKLGEDSHKGSVKQQKEKNLSIQTDIELHSAEQHWKPLHLTGRSKFIEEEEKRESGDILLGSRGKLGEESPGGSMTWLKEKNLFIQRDVKLHHAEHPWKPSRLTDRSKLSEEEQKSEELCKKVRAILNKLTPQKFQTLVAKMQVLQIDTETRLRTVIDMVFEKAVNEPHFCVAYANMCRCFSMFEVPSDRVKGHVNFRALILTRIQREFENNSSEKEFVVKRKESEKAATEEEKQKLKEEMEHQQMKAQKRSLGTIRFVGELFKLKMLTENIMHDCVFKLLRTKDEDCIECLCILLRIIGKVLDTEKAKGRMNQYFTQMQKVVNEKKLSPTVCFKLQDVIELRQNNWVSRRDESYPKTIDQIHREVEQEEQDQSLILQKLPRFKVRGKMFDAKVLDADYSKKGAASTSRGHNQDSHNPKTLGFWRKKQGSKVSKSDEDAKTRNENYMDTSEKPSATQPSRAWRMVRGSTDIQKHIIIHNNCNICKKTSNNPVKLNKCGHVFCKECIDASLQCKAVCPVCDTV